MKTEVQRTSMGTEMLSAHFHWWSWTLWDAVIKHGQPLETLGSRMHDHMLKTAVIGTLVKHSTVSEQSSFDWILPEQ